MKMPSCFGGLPCALDFFQPDGCHLVLRRARVIVSAQTSHIIHQGFRRVEGGKKLSQTHRVLNSDGKNCLAVAATDSDVCTLGEPESLGVLGRHIRPTLEPHECDLCHCAISIQKSVFMLRRRQLCGCGVAIFAHRQEADVRVPLFHVQV